MDKKTYISVCQVQEMDEISSRGDPVMGLSVYDTYGNGTGVVHLVPGYTRDELLQASAEELVELACEVSHRVMELAVDLTVRGKAFDIEQWRKERSIGM